MLTLHASTLEGAFLLEKAQITVACFWILATFAGLLTVIKLHAWSRCPSYSFCNFIGHVYPNGESVKGTLKPCRTPFKHNHCRHSMWEETRVYPEKINPLLLQEHWLTLFTEMSWVWTGDRNHYMKGARSLRHSPKQMCKGQNFSY